MSCRTALVALALGLQLRESGACTTLAAGRNATSDGSVLVSHSDDGESRGDPRLCYVPAKTYKAGEKRPIFWDTENYPRYVGSNRGSCYLPQPGQKAYTPIGFIPQVEHTFGYYESTYGALNEHGVGIGESTCSAVFGTNSAGHGGKALLSVDTLTQIAMERAKTAREAVKLIGSLAEQYGFYAAESFEGSAESLFIGDPEEVFVFHILPDDTGTSAIWAAQRVPDDHVSVVPNIFIIRNIDFEDSKNFLYSASVKTVAQKKGWWSPGTLLDFTAIYSDGEYANKFYSGRRIWGGFRRMGITDLPFDYTDLRYHAVYPVTAKPPAPTMSPQQFFAVHRDFYDGTQFDTSKGLAAGPYNDPDRWAVSTKLKGAWERTISLYRTTSVHVTQLRRSGQGSVLWFGPAAAASTCFVPLLASGTSVPEPLQIADPAVLSRKSAYWAFRYSYNVAKLQFKGAWKDVRALQDRLEAEGADLIAQLDAQKIQIGNAEGDIKDHVDKVMAAFWLKADEIIQDYSNGWLKDGSSVGYPDWWLQAVGYQNGPPPPPSGPGSCSDDQVESCLQGCSKGSGFATCAASCTAPCSTNAVMESKHVLKEMDAAADAEFRI